MRNAIVWQCRRSASICAELKTSGKEPAFVAKTGLILDPYFSGTKLSWIFREDPSLYEKADRGELAFGTVVSWLLFNLTGEHLTDATNASRTLMYDIHKGGWDEELLSILGVPKNILPEVRPSIGDFGLTRPSLFGAAIPVTGCAGDQQAALFGHACFSAGDAKNTYGTGCFALMNTGEKPVASKNGLLTTIAWDLGGQGGLAYALEGSVFIGGAVIQWLRDELGLIKDSAESETLAASVPDSGGVYIVPAFVGLGAPHWDAQARGAIVGLTRGSGKAQIVRAALESVAYQSADLVGAMETDAGFSLRSLKADGGASANSFLMQFQADILGRPVIVPEVNEITALGAAYLAGLRTGYWNGLEEVARNWRKRRTFEPDMSQSRRTALKSGWNKALAASRSFRPE
jgi:glycerol kinase